MPRINPSLLIGILITASLGLVAGVYLWLGPARTPAPMLAPDGDPGLVAQATPRQATYDSAARLADEDEDDATNAAPRLPAIRPNQPNQPQPSEPTARPDAPAPIPPDAATLAAQEIFFALRDRVGAEAQRRLDGERAALRRACWRPELAGGASSASFRVAASFDAAGALVAVGISEPPDGAATGVAQCLRQRVLDLKVAAPGTGLNVDIQLLLP